MTLDQIRYVLCIVREGSMSKAAPVLFMTQPNLSAAIRKLEMELGYPLFERTSKGMELTERGVTFCNYANEIMLHLKRMQSIKTQAPIFQTEFRVGSQFFSISIEILHQLHKKYCDHETRFTIRQMGMLDLTAAVSEGKLDLGLIHMPTTMKNSAMKILEGRGLDYTPLFDISQYLSMSETHPLADRDNVTLEDVKDYPLVYLNHSEKEFLYAPELYQMGASTFKNKIYVEDFLYYVYTLKNLNAVSFTIRNDYFYIGDLMKDFNIKLKTFPTDGAVICNVGYIKKTGSSLTPPAHDFIQLLMQYMLPPATR